MGDSIIIVVWFVVFMAMLALSLRLMPMPDAFTGSLGVRWHGPLPISLIFLWTGCTTMTVLDQTLRKYETSNNLFYHILLACRINSGSEG